MAKQHESSKEKAENRKRFERKRYLNVIYFIDSNRTHTLKFSIGTSYFTVGALSAAVVWALISTTLLIRDHLVISDLRTHSQSLLEMVFNYQTRYDEVYEKAYPNNSPLVATNKDETPAVAPDQAKTSETMSLAAAATPTPAAPAVDKTADLSPKEKAVSQPLASNSPPITIDNFKTQMGEKSMTIRLSLKNLNSQQKTSGSVHATAAFVGVDGKSYELSSHPVMMSDDKSNDENFNIRNFKNKAFYFEPPHDVAGGRFLSVVVIIKDEAGRSKEFSYPLNKEFKRYKAQPAEPVATAAPVAGAEAPAANAAPTAPESQTTAAPAAATPPAATEETPAPAEPAAKAGDTEAEAPSN